MRDLSVETEDGCGPPLVGMGSSTSLKTCKTCLCGLLYGSMGAGWLPAGRSLVEEAGWLRRRGEVGERCLREPVERVNAPLVDSA